MRRPTLRARVTGLALALALGSADAFAGCSKSPAPGEDVSSTALPPITICFEPDGAPCPPPDGGDEAGEDAEAVDAAMEAGGG
jgi:hypothetical protein